MTHAMVITIGPFAHPMLFPTPLCWLPQKIGVTKKGPFLP